MSSGKCSGLVIRATALREADLIVTILSPELGRLSAVARSGRRSKKRFMGGVDIFDCAEFELSPPRGSSNLYTLSGMQNRTPWPRLRSSLRKFALASLAVETAEALSHEGDPDAALLFNPLKAVLTGIDRSTTSQQAHECIVFFLLQTLRESGYDPTHLPFEDAENLRAWWEEMTARGKPTPAQAENHVSRSFSVLCGFVENTLNRALKSRTQLGL
ncbi:MAG: DNA repair protein RecO [Bdellovibrionales bacterium]|nr:DNA repair protein RecO [Bdellovibrionales bacterium]